MIPISLLTDNTNDRIRWWPIIHDDKECVGKIQLSIGSTITCDETSQIKDELEALKESGDKSALDAKFKEVMGNEHPGSVQLHGRCVTKTSLKHASAHETSMAEKQQERERLKDELRVELRQETADQIRTEFQMLVSCLRDANPLMVIPANMPTFPMDNRNPNDSSSAPRNALSSAATNSPSGVLVDEVEDGS